MAPTDYQTRKYIEKVIQTGEIGLVIFVCRRSVIIGEYYHLKC